MSDALDGVLGQVGGSRRILSVVVVLGAIAAIWGFSRWGMAPSFIPLVPNLPLESVGEVTQSLEEEGIEFRLERGGSTVAVAEADVVRARVVLAQEGIPAGGKPGFELFDEAAWGMTDFTQRVNYRRALEGELQRTIVQMRGVDDAQVHLAIQESSFLKRDTPAAEASVVLALRAGARPDKAMVDGVAFLVASSVEGLSRENVTVLDDTGRLLSSPDDMGTAAGLTNRQLAVRQDVEGYLETKAYELVEQIVGPGNATIRVAANLNFDEVGRTVEQLDLDNQARVSEDRAEIIPGSEEQGAGSVETSTVYETPRTVETLNRAGARIERLAVAVLVNHRQVGEGENLQYEARPASELAQVEALVRNAVGITPVRGDAITVASVPFDRRPPPPAPVVEEGPDVMAILQAAARPSVGILGAVFAFLLALKLLGSLKSAAPAGGRRSLPPGEEEFGEALGGDSEGAPVISPPRAEAPPKVEVADPNMTARVVRAWMNES